MNALALVIGNADYINSKDKLINAVNDAEDFSDKLWNLGFIVKSVKDCDNEGFDRAARSFGEDLKKYDVGLFYFSGHGLQIEGRNYLTSIDTSFVDSLSAKHTSFPLDEIIERMQLAGPKIKILILDACRNNPLPSHYRSPIMEGLAPIHAPKGTIIAFSTSPGEKAMDYGAGRNSIYTGSLLNHIDDSNIPIEEFFKRVRTSVFTLSAGKQTSWEHTSLIGTFCFNSGQLVHSMELPYREDCIADENFESNGSEIDKIIDDLKSYHFYTQQPAFTRLKNIEPTLIDESYQFLLGRNVLQTAIGGVFAAKSIMQSLDNWLEQYNINEKNHVLNGILYEIYFNSKGQFRQADFKNDYIEELFNLQNQEKYNSSFEFINKQLTPFSNFLFYLPNISPTTLAIEVQFEATDYEVVSNRTGWRLMSIKHEEVELLVSFEDEHSTLWRYAQFEEQLRKQLCVPKSRLKLSLNIPKESLEIILMPWNLNLSRQKLKNENVKN